jgi:hypothetical protein
MAEKKTENAAVAPKQAEAKAEVDALVKKGLKALEEFSRFDQDQIDYIVATISSSESVCSRLSYKAMLLNFPRPVQKALERLVRLEASMT